MISSPEDLEFFRQNAVQSLLAELTPDGHWEGELSTSALSTATAIVALHELDKKYYHVLIQDGVDWLLNHQNEDGGWGDTTKSFSNISTSLLAWSAIQKCRSANLPEVQRASYWIRDYVGSMNPELIAETVKARYGKDRTFSVPILMLCAICGTLGKRGWKLVLPMPYELAAFPRSWFAALKMPVVSYALPALIAIGRARCVKVSPNPFFPLFWLRLITWPRVSKLLHNIQPESGGFLEAAPLTSFVTMALASIKKKKHPAVIAGAKFLEDTVRPNGSWPIDTNLATWATTLAIKSFHPTVHCTVDDCTLYSREKLLNWLLDQQYKSVHPFTNSPPGGWAWTDLSGGVPDADDTPGAMLAIRILADESTFETCRQAAENGATWLLDLQNNDGGIPTFCKGWGTLPFDRSSPDLTAHTLRAWAAWKDDFPKSLQYRIEKGTKAGLHFLKRQQCADGSWIPLWFGNQYRLSDEENPTYGTAMVCRALEDLSKSQDVDYLLQPALNWLRENQNADGGWGGGSRTPSSIEETGLAVSALANYDSEAVVRGVQWLLEATKMGTQFPASPIGFYFAKLWYHEKIYPLVWTLEALNRAKENKPKAPVKTNDFLAGLNPD